MTDKTGSGRGRRESPASGYHAAQKEEAQKQPSPQQTPEERAKAAFDSVLEHPFWGEIPKALSNGFDRFEQFLDKGEFSEELADRIAGATRLVVERGRFGEPEAAFLAAARAAFGERKSFVASAIDFAQTIAVSVDLNNKQMPQQVRDRLDLARFICIAAREQPELLDLLNDSSYKGLDDSVCNNPHLDALMNELVTNGCLVGRAHKNAVLTMLSPLQAKWTEERCEAAREVFKANRYFCHHTLADLRGFVEKSRTTHAPTASKILPVAHALRVMYAEEMVLRCEAICYVMQAARTSHHA